MLLRDGMQQEAGNRWSLLLRLPDFFMGVARALLPALRQCVENAGAKTPWEEETRHENN